MADQLAELQGLISANRYNNFQGQTFEVAGDLVMPDDRIVENLRIKQLDPKPERRTIHKQLGWGLRLINVEIDRGADASAGSIADSAGLWLNGVDDVELVDVEVTGHGRGAGMMLYGLSRPTLRGLKARNMRFSASADPGSEQIVGIWLQACKDFTLDAPVVSGLDALLGGAQRYYQTDGISISGCSDFSVAGAQVSFCGEGIDASGSAGNKAFSIIGGNYTDCDSFGVKLANSASDATVSGVIAARCGFSGFVISGPAQSGLPRCERITLSGCLALDTGSNGRWAAYNTVGFGIMASSYEPTLPEKVRFVECRAIDRQATKTMKYGFRNENNNTANKMLNCSSEGHLVTAVLGVFG